MPPFHIRFDSQALEQWQAVRRCSFVDRICYLGFPCRWLVSLKGGTDTGEQACKQAVSCEIPDSKELQNK